MSEREEEIKRAFEHNKIQRDEPFYFKCTQCGECCQNRGDIILSPFDIYEIAKALNESMDQVVEKYGNIYIGPTSKMPLVSLRMRTEDGKCPFLKDNLCGIHKNKPSVCVLYPLGRAAMGQKGSTELEMSYFLQEINCGTKDEVHTPREWIGAFKIAQSEERFMVWQKMFLVLSERLIELLPKIPERAAEALLAGICSTLYAQYDMEKPIMLQIKENVDNVTKVLDKTEQFIKMLEENAFEL